MDVKKLTRIFIVAVILTIIAFDVYVFIAGGTEATVSWTMFEWGHKYPSIPFFMGYVMGHFFWQMKAVEKLK